MSLVMRSPVVTRVALQLKLWAVLIIVGCFQQISAQVAISLAPGSGSPGAVVSLNISVTSGATLPSGLQWDLGYSQTDVSSIAVTMDPRLSATKQLSCTQFTPTVLRCILFGFNQSTITNGVVATAAVTLSPTTTSTSTALTMTNQSATDGNAVSLPNTTATGNTITIAQAPVNVSVTVNTNPSGLSITVDGSTFTAPRTFSWVPGSSHTIATTATQSGSGGRALFANWSDGGAVSHTVTAVAAIYTASFNTQFLLTTSASGGTITPTPASPTGDGYYNNGTSVQLTATPNSGQQFSSWSGDATGSANPVSVLMTLPRNVTANFIAAPQSFTVTTIPAGLGITVDGVALTSPQTFSWTLGSTHTIATLSPQGSGGTRRIFASWSDGGAISHTVTPSAATTYTANFNTQFLLTTSASGGTITPNPASPAGDGFYNSGTSVQLTANASSGNQFSSWSGDATGTTNPVTVSMTAARNVTATFSSAPQSFTVTTVPAGLSIMVDGVASISPQTFSWTPGSTHTIGTSSPQGSGGTRRIFASWSDGGAISHTVTPSVATTYAASFNTQFLLSTSASGGTITPTPASPSGDGFYNNGTSVQLSATPNSGQQFSSWSGDATGSTNPTTVAMTAPRNVTAAFTAAPQSFTVTTIPAGLSITVDGAASISPQSFSWTPGSTHTIATSSPQGSGGTRRIFTSWSDGGAISHTVTASVATTYTANFNTQFLLTTSASGGTVTPTPASPAGDGFYNSGTSVQLTANASSGQQFSSWSGDAAGTTNPVSVSMTAPRNVTATFSSAPQSFTVTTVPAGLAITVDGVGSISPQTFSWTPGSTHTIGTSSPQGSGGTRRIFANWSDGGAMSHTVTPSGATTYTANFNTQFLLTTSASGGTITPTPAAPAGDGFYNSGTSVQLTANPSSGNQFSSWSGDATGTTNPVTVSMTAPRNVTANFPAAAQSFTVTTSPAGLSVTVDGVTAVAPQTFQWTPGSTHTIATTATQGSNGTRNVFSNWSDGGAVSHTVTPATATTYIATFNRQYLLTTSASGGSVSALPVSPAGDGYYNNGAAVQLTATPNSGQQFSSWSGDATGTTNPVSVSMTAPRNVTAAFSAAPQSFTVTTVPSGLSITVDGVASTAPQTFQWTPGSNHTIGTTASQGSGGTRNSFTSWSDGGGISHSITATSGTTYVATFATQYLLTRSASNGTISANPGSPTGDGFYNNGTAVQLTATPNSGQQFSSWSGDATGTANPVTVTMNAPRNVTASFGSAPQSFTVTTNPSGLSITVDGSTFAAPQTFQWTPGSSHTIGTALTQGGGGSRSLFAGWSDGGAASHVVTPSTATTYVASFNTQYLLTTSGSGGSVTPTPASPGGDGFYNSGTTVQLSATPNSGQQFTSWSGDASGTSNPVLVAMSAPRNIVANFSSQAQGITINTNPAGLSIVVDGNTLTSPQTFQWTSGSSHSIGTITPQGSGGTRYGFTSWSDGGTQTHTVFTPASSATYTANFTTQYLLTTSASGGTIAASPSSADGFHNSGTVVQLTANASAGNQFSSWSGGASGSTNPVTVTMNAPRNVTANFPASAQGITVTTIPSGLSITVDGTAYVAPQTFQWTPGSNHAIGATATQGAGSSRNVFSTWSDGGAVSHAVSPSTATTYTANFATQYLLTTSASGGTVTPNPASLTGDGFYNSGTAVQLTATPSSGNQFSAWSGDASGTTSPTAVTMSAPRNVTATFTAAPVSFTVTTTPSGLSINVDGTPYTAPRTFQWTPGSNHTIATSASQGSGGTRYVFASWSDSGDASHTVTPSTASTYVASFNTQYLLTTSASGGTITPSPASPGGDGFYNSGTSVQLTAGPSSGQQFSSWSGDGSGTTNPLAVSMTAPRNVIANFAASAQGITIATNPAGLTILVDGATFTAPQTFQWTPGSNHTINASSPQGSGGTRYTFFNWSDAGAQSHNIFAPSASTTYTANFTTQYLLTTSGSGGSVLATPASPGGDGFYNTGTSVQLTATPSAGQKFNSWSGDASGTTNPVSISMSASRSVTASFGAASQSFTINTNPTGLTLVIDGATFTAPQSFQWTAGSSHTLTTVPTQGGVGARHQFSSWSDGGAQSHTITTSSTIAYTANFTTQYQIAATGVPAGSGSVLISPASSDGYYAAGTTVQLTPVPASGYRFGSWSGDFGGSTTPAMVALTSPKAVTANFTSTSNAPNTNCTFTLDSGNFSIASEGDIARVQLTTDSTCQWTASSNSNWIIITNSSGTGGGPVTFTAAANPGANLRSGSITVAGQTVLVNQASAGCGGGFATTASTNQVQGDGGPVSVTVAAAPGCEWSSAVAPSDWLNVSSGTFGNGNGLSQVSASANPSTVFRTGSITVGGQTTKLLQFGGNLPQVFPDVPSSHLFANYITLLQTNNAAVLCSNGNGFCPDTNTTRGEMAAFIIRSLYGDSFPFQQTGFFTDVTTSHPYFKYIQKMKELGITVGCTTITYCPDNSVTRGEMAVFLVRARLGVSAAQNFPYPPASYFGDVAGSHSFYPFIQKIKQMGFTAGCTATTYCPNLPTTRGQMAVFLTRAFFTP